MVAIWTCQGDVCGCCDIKHRSFDAAKRCSGRHHSAIVRHNGRSAYSDRQPVPMNAEAKARHADDAARWQDEEECW